MATNVAESPNIAAQNTASMDELRAAMVNLALAQQKTELAQQKTESFLQETARVMGENAAKTDLSLQELKWIVKETSRQIGGIGNDIGEIYELVLLAGIVDKINEHGHNFGTIAHRYEFKKPGVGNGNFTEIDLVLGNGSEIMFVEVKSNFKSKWVTEFTERIVELRQNEAVTGLTGKTVFAAIAGLHFSKDAREIAAENGIYLIEVDEKYENDKLKIIPPPGNIGKW